MHNLAIESASTYLFTLTGIPLGNNRGIVLGIHVYRNFMRIVQASGDCVISAIVFEQTNGCVIVLRSRTMLSLRAI